MWNGGDLLWVLTSDMAQAAKGKGVQGMQGSVGVCRVQDGQEPEEVLADADLQDLQTPHVREWEGGCVEL